MLASSNIVSWHIACFGLSLLQARRYGAQQSNGRRTTSGLYFVAEIYCCHFEAPVLTGPQKEFKLVRAMQAAPMRSCLWGQSDSWLQDVEQANVGGQVPQIRSPDSRRSRRTKEQRSDNNTFSQRSSGSTEHACEPQLAHEELKSTLTIRFPMPSPVSPPLITPAMFSIPPCLHILCSTRKRISFNCAGL